MYVLFPDFGIPLLAFRQKNQIKEKSGRDSNS
jgi:hypothetical protein